MSTRKERLDALQSSRVREHLWRLHRRYDYLEAQVAAATGKPRNGYAAAELVALGWAIDVLEAAALIGTLPELERVAGMEDPPTPEEWARRGEVVAPVCNACNDTPERCPVSCTGPVYELTPTTEPHA